MADRLIPRESAVYHEFARLYRLARDLRPTAVDRWNGTLYATDSERWGAFNAKTGAMRLSAAHTLRHLTGSRSPTDPEEQAQALATVLHEATHAGMTTDAPDEPNAVRSQHSLGLMEGLAEVRALQDFATFARRAGYAGLELPAPSYPGAYAATQSLLQQVSGPAKSRLALIDEALHGPGVMHFDQLADAVLRNRLAEVVPFHEGHRQQVRAALIGAMAHRGWPILKDSPADTGATVAEEIRRTLNSKVDEIRRHYRAKPSEVFAGGVPNPAAALARAPGRDTGDPARAGAAVGAGTAGPPKEPSSAPPEMRFLGGLAGAAGAVRVRPALGHGWRGQHAEALVRDTGPERG